MILLSLLTSLWLLGTIPVWRSFRRDTPAVGLWPRAKELLLALCWPISVAFTAIAATVFAYLNLIWEHHE
jgi:hypothetical protein